MYESNVVAALDRGALVVTANQRLAREIASRHDAAQLAAGRTTWPAANVLPWSAFIVDLVRRAQDAGLPVPARRLDAQQSAVLWQRVVANALADSPLVSVDAIASLAEDAWEHLQGYANRSDAWRHLPPGTPDADAFTRWAEAYARELTRLDALDVASAVNALAGVVAALPGVARQELVLAGFVEHSPAQCRLIDALRATGASVVTEESPAETSLSGTARLARAATPQSELIAAFDWARERASGDAGRQVGIVVLDLAQRRKAVRALAEDRLCPNLQQPGRESAPRPYDISLGPPLAEVPIVACALDLIALRAQPLARGRAATLVRAPYLPDAASAWMARAAIERVWLEQGVASLDVNRLVTALADADLALAARWRRASQAVPAARLASPRGWVEHWRNWLDACGWGEGRALDSAEFQAQGAFHELLSSFARLSAIVSELRTDEAHATLHRLANEQVFQPQSRGARIRILGLLEATGLSFDALWVAGMAGEAWPRAPQPNPLLPIGWQRASGVPRSSSVLELAFARNLTAKLSHAAPEVVFSYAAQADDHERAPSALVAALPSLAIAHAPTTAERMFGERPSLQSLDDSRAPAANPGEALPGGTAIIEAQSACPFRAAAEHRLQAKEWPSPTLGLSLRERGTLIHATLAAFWNETRDRATLVALSEAALDERLTRAVATGCSAIDAKRWQSIPRAVAAVETDCLATIARSWLAVERDRPPFTVLETEVKTTAALAGYTFNVRLDRVDAIGEGGLAVVDYKAGRVGSTSRWFDARPQGLQLAMYAAAQAQRDAKPIAALTYARLRRGEIAVLGLAAEAGAWPGVPTADLVANAGANWNEARTLLHASVTTLARDCGNGEARVDPRDAKVCSLCRLHAVCRIGSALADADDAIGEVFDDA